MEKNRDWECWVLWNVGYSLQRVVKYGERVLNINVLRELWTMKAMLGKIQKEVLESLKNVYQNSLDNILNWEPVVSDHLRLYLINQNV